ncbi:Ulp1 protease family protein [Abeliophyllum distichum]|uniref:Ulp1 protease family protein n=1 Tax=Abeliophyllum distichum TaxID=126358 RepID=A0ABD1SXA3_9LAMI
MEFGMGSQRPKVETQRVTERVVTTDVPAVFFTRKKRNDKEMVKSKELAGKRLRVPSGHLSSPLTATINRRNFIDGSKIDLFQKVDPVKETEFLKWYSKIGTGMAYELGSVRLTDAKEWFNDVLTDGKWLADDMTKEFREDNFTIPNYLFDYVHGKSQLNGQPWEGCTHLYIPVLANAHWFAVEINFAESALYVYDPDKSCLTQGQLEKFLESVYYFIPLLAKSVNISVQDKVQVQRVDDTVKQKFL